MQTQYLYIVLSQTGSFPSRVLHLFTQDEYNHSSIATEPYLNEMYSFGRLHAKKPFPGGFVRESPTTGTFLRFNRAKAIVLGVPLSQEQYTDAVSFLRKMYQRRRQYHYNYLGVFAGLINRRMAFKNRYFCSEFVKCVLDRYGITYDRPIHKVVRPMDFLSVTGGVILFRGTLKDCRSEYLTPNSQPVTAYQQKGDG